MYLYDHVSIAMFQTISLYLLYRKRVTERQAGIDREREGREEGRERETKLEIQREREGREEGRGPM